MFERILLAIDETPAGEVAVSFATAMARHSRGRVHVVHANLLLVGGRGVAVETPEQAAQVVAGALAQLRSADVEASGEVFTATMFDVAGRIADCARRVGADSVVLGSHRHRRVARLAGRGLRERLVRTTALPVVTAPAPLKVGRRRKGSVEIGRLARNMAPADQPR
jgi:nucleotide-binding universal stress UspA family protein